MTGIYDIKTFLNAVIPANFNSILNAASFYKFFLSRKLNNYLKLSDKKKTKNWKKKNINIKTIKNKS